MTFSECPADSLEGRRKEYKNTWELFLRKHWSVPKQEVSLVPFNVKTYLWASANWMVTLALALPGSLFILSTVKTHFNHSLFSIAKQPKFLVLHLTRWQTITTEANLRALINEANNSLEVTEAFRKKVNKTRNWLMKIELTKGEYRDRSLRWNILLTATHPGVKDSILKYQQLIFFSFLRGFSQTPSDLIWPVFHSTYIGSILTRSTRKQPLLL